MNHDEHKIVVRRMRLAHRLPLGAHRRVCAAADLSAARQRRQLQGRATNTTDYNFTVTAARGDIVDSAGRRIAASTTSYNVVLSKLLMGGEDLDAMLQRIVELLEHTARAGTTRCSSASRMPAATIRLRLRRTAPATRRPRAMKTRWAYSSTPLPMT